MKKLTHCQTVKEKIAGLFEGKIPRLQVISRT